MPSPWRDLYYNLTHPDSHSTGTVWADVVIQILDDLFRLEWKKITSDSIPALGDEVLYQGGMVMEVDLSKEHRTYLEWHLSQALYYRPINAPEEDVHGKSKEGK